MQDALAVDYLSSPSVRRYVPDNPEEHRHHLMMLV